MMRFSYLIVIAIVFFSFKQTTEQKDIHVIPKPQQVEFTKTEFTVTRNTTILFPEGNASLEKIAGYLQKEIHEMVGLHLETKSSINESKKNAVYLISDIESKLGKEEYILESNHNQVKIFSRTPNGSFYGVQTLIQLFDVKQTKDKITFSTKIPGVRIQDKPRFKWRGMHLDVCRHFYDKEFVKKYIDLLAMHKMNTFHWHLTEDQGWRIEIKKYPKLTEVGSYRSETMIGKNWEEFDDTPHGGFYTQEDIKEVVQYATDRFVTIVPEIEMPGHSLAALASYPEYGCTGGPYEVAKTWGVFNDVYCAGNDRTFEFLENVLAEVIELFPGKYIHIGGDECPKDQWEKCPKCQQRIKEEGLKNEFELQSYFIKRIEQFLITKDKKIIGWDEILEGGLAAEATVMSWRGTKGGIEAAKMGHHVVMSPNNECYFDHYQGEPENEPLAIGGYTNLKDVYHYEPVPEELSDEEKKYVLGAQANLWTEYIATEDHLEYMVLPRMSALSEVVWDEKASKDFEDFKNRLEKHLLRLQFRKYNYKPL